LVNERAALRDNLLQFPFALVTSTGDIFQANRFACQLLTDGATEKVTLEVHPNLGFFAHPLGIGE
jgi:hypothetical protein